MLVKRNVSREKGSTEMTYVYDFCGMCSDGETVKLSFFDVDSNDFITSVVLNNAKTGAKTLSAVCGYGYVEYFYTSADMICANVRVHRDDM